MDAVERLVNLALFLAEAREPVTRERVRKEVAGYGDAQEDEAFLRMFERDKELLKSGGFVINADELGNYRLDARRTYVSRIELFSAEAAALKAAGAALLEDPSFPFAPELRLALAKIEAEFKLPAVESLARLADERPVDQASILADLLRAARSRKRARFDYTNARGGRAPHEVEPLGVFLHDGRWYVVGRDVSKDEIRTYAVSRIEGVLVNARAPKSADFQRPADFDVSRYIRLPFQYGPESDEFEAVVRFDADIAWRAPHLAGGEGALERDGGGDDGGAGDGGDDGGCCGSTVWRVRARCEQELVRFVIENGPGLEILEPEAARGLLVRGLERVVASHG